MRVEMLEAQGRAWLIHDFLSSAECEGYIAQGEGLGFATAPLTTADGPLMAPEVRNNGRAMMDDPALAGSLWNRARDLVPARMEDWEDRMCHAVGLNERFRFFRYEPGQRFARHYDGSFQRNHEEASLLTFMVYLNEGCEGGSTNFYTEYRRPWFAVRPKTGTALVFVHPMFHEGERVVSGCKYVLRTDVMYRR